MDRRGASHENSRDAATHGGFTAAEMEEMLRHERHNMLWLATYQIVLRIGWIFKTESVIMPAFVDWVSGGSASVLRSLLPMLNRIGQSVPPLFFSSRLRALRRKKWALVAFPALMGAPFLVLAVLWFAVEGAGAWWMPAVFLASYFLFFCCTGLNNICFGTVQGKLIRPARRGRLLASSSFLGAFAAIAFAWWLMPKWLGLPGGGFGYLFAFTGACFVLAACCVTLTRETVDSRVPADDAPAKHLAAALSVVRGANFRRLALVAMMFSTAVMLFPHYQALAREQFGLHLEHLMTWVVVQNIAVGCASLLIGPLADNRGNRLALRLLMFLNAIAPLLAIALASVDAEVGRRWFWLVFAPLGMAPITIKTMNNYALEICQPSEHPRYLSTLSLCLAFPFLLSPAIGWLTGQAGFRPVFLGCAAVVLCGALMTFRLSEPRHEIPLDETPTPLEE